MKKGIRSTREGGKSNKMASHPPPSPPFDAPVSLPLDEPLYEVRSTAATCLPVNDQTAAGGSCMHVAELGGSLQGYIPNPLAQLNLHGCPGLFEQVGNYSEFEYIILILD